MKCKCLKGNDASESGGFTQSIDYDSDKNEFNVNGCCGGGCYIVFGMKYCPFCGRKLTEGMKELECEE